MTRRQQLLDFAILGLLHDAPMHGYELRKHLNLTMGVFRALSYGTLYPALRVWWPVAPSRSRPTRAL